MEFKYFKHPEQFAYKISKPAPCSVCGTVDLCFDAGSYFGGHDLECICESCLLSGALIELGVETNMVADENSEAAKTIIYKTPALPTWQDSVWPVIDGKYPVFERIASVEDFEDKQEFLNSYINLDQNTSDIEWLWDELPKKRLSHYNEGRDISVYLFSLNDKKYWIWDSN